MLTTKVIDPNELDAAERNAFKEMATWRYAELFDRSATDYHLLVGLYDEEGPKGVVIARLSFNDRVCKIHHHFVDPSVNQMEGLKQLFGEIDTWAEQNYFRLLSIFYPLTNENAALDQYLDTHGWADRFPIQEQYLYESKLFSPRWLKRGVPIPKDFVIVPWAEMTEAHKSSLQNTIQGAGLSDYLTPNYYQEYLLEWNTLILINNDRVVGWAVTHTFPDSPDTVEYSSLFIHPLYRYHGYSIRLLVDAIRIHIDSEVKYGLFKLSLSEISNNWKRFIKRNLEANSQEKITVVKRRKLLPGP